jgi:hypothetical protein
MELNVGLPSGQAAEALGERSGNWLGQPLRESNKLIVKVYADPFPGICTIATPLFTNSR